MVLKLSNSVRTENMILSFCHPCLAIYFSVHFQNISIVAYVNNNFKNNYNSNNNRPTNKKTSTFNIFFLLIIVYNALNTWEFYVK